MKFIGFLLFLFEDQIRLCRRLKTIESDLKKQLETVEKDRDFLKDSVANHLEQVNTN